MPLDILCPHKPSGTAEASMDRVCPQACGAAGRQSRRAVVWPGEAAWPLQRRAGCHLPPAFAPWLPLVCLKGVRWADLHGRCEEESALVPVTAGYVDLSLLLYIHSGTWQGIS